jgi:hypothetical protein
MLIGHPEKKKNAPFLFVQENSNAEAVGGGLDYVYEVGRLSSFVIM